MVSRDSAPFGWCLGYPFWAERNAIREANSSRLRALTSPGGIIDISTSVRFAMLSVWIRVALPAGLEGGVVVGGDGGGVEVMFVKELGPLP
jgi:hypothetical protein